MNKKNLLGFLDRRLLPQGFERQKATWNRVLGDFVEVIDVQSSKIISRVTLNCGIVERSVDALCRGHETKPFVEEPYCNVRARIGELIGDMDKWWDFQKDPKLDLEMDQEITDRILPFLERTRSLQGMKDWLVQKRAETTKYPLPGITLAVVRHRLGEQEEACLLLASLWQRTTGGWKKRVEEVATRIGCPESSS